MYYENPDGVSVHAGFPNPAADASLQGIDLNRLLIKNSVSTYMMRIVGNDWQDRGIFDSDLVLIDRALHVRKTDLVAWHNGQDFSISPWHTVPEGGEVWGVVTACVHLFENDFKKEL